MFDAIIATNSKGKISIFNPAAEQMLNLDAGDLIGRRIPDSLSPFEFRDSMEAGNDICTLSETEIVSNDNDEIPVRFSGVALRQDKKFIGTAMFMQDLRKIKQLEKEKIDAERLAVVGQTVAGLAHGIKNILTGLEGGMYVVNTGLKQGRKDRIDTGWEMLERNIGRISALAKSLLSFSKGGTPKAVMINPCDIARDVVALYQEAAQRAGIQLECRSAASIAPAPFDPEEIHTCLANLVSNALDACQMSEKAGCRVSLETREEDNCIIYEVSDEGSGMDYEIKQKVFTNFFTTKGSEGTGLGLLLTRKIVQEHGGRITVDSEPGEGSLFRLMFPREHLPDTSNSSEE
jgi:PAS domain S-box-containing protein